jgi:exopolyphosphatase/guanosine-5'-triphosphate,3'-diphosphate pyrophosphatase
LVRLERVEKRVIVASSNRVDAQQPILILVTRILAAADIGSNTAHLLVAATDGSLVMRIDNYNEWIPLGEMVAKTGGVPKEQGQQLVSAVKEIKRICKDKQCPSLFVFATEALRVAANRDQVIKKIHAETGVVVELISPTREAELSYLGIGLDTRNLHPDILFEVGGGSVQIARIENNAITETQSLPLGTGRLVAEAEIRYPSTDLSMRKLKNYIDSTLAGCTLNFTPEVAVVSGGVARGLWRALHPDGDKLLQLEEIEYMAWSAPRLPRDRIVTRFNVKNRRAGTLLPGALVYQALLKRFSLKEMVVSEFGIREGAVLKMAAGEIEGSKV